MIIVDEMDKENRNDKKRNPFLKNKKGKNVLEEDKEKRV